MVFESAHALHQRVGLAQDRVRLRLCEVRLRKRALQHGVEIGRDRAHLLNGRAAGTAAPAAASAAAQSGALRTAVHAHARIDARHLRAGARHAAYRSAGLRAQQRGVRQQRTVAIGLDAEIVLDGQRDGIRHRQVEFARANQAIQAARIVEPHRRHDWRAVRTQNLRPLGLLHGERELRLRPALQGRQNARYRDTALHSQDSHLPTARAGRLAGITLSRCTCPEIASSIEMWFTSSVRPIARSNAILAWV